MATLKNDEQPRSTFVCKYCGNPRYFDIPCVCPLGDKNKTCVPNTFTKLKQTTDEQFTYAATVQGLRYNEGKSRPDLIPPQVIMALADHYRYGANKYHANNWLEGFPYSDTFASLCRHLFAWYSGETNDPESGHHHLIAVIWNAVALMYFELNPATYKKFDNRPFANQTNDETKD